MFRALQMPKATLARRLLTKAKLYYMPSSVTTPPTSRSIAELDHELTSVLTAYTEAPDAAASVAALNAWRIEAAAAIAALSARDKASPDVTTALGLIERMGASGRWDQPVTEAELNLADSCAPLGWPGLLAAMLLVPAWQWQNAPELERVPTWLWGPYTRYLFTPPQGFRALGQAEAYPRFCLQRLTELQRLAERNRGSSAIRAALEAYLRTANCIPLYFVDDSLKRHYELRGRILTLAEGIRPAEDLPPLPREGRRLKVGFINRHFSSQTETYTTLPTFEHLDPDQFEVILFSVHRTDTDLEKYCRGRAAEFHFLPSDSSSQLQVLRDAMLDIAVFGTNVTAVLNEVTRLALHRVAPLQVVNNSSCTTTGLPEIDLYVSGTLTEETGASDHFTERLGLLPGPAHAFNYEADRQDPTLHWTRESLGIPSDVVVFVSAANYYKITPEMQVAWAKLLAAVPGSRLLLHPFNPNWASSYPIKRFTDDFDRVLTAHGVSLDQLVVSTLRFPSRCDVRELLRIGDIYLDTFPFAGVNSLVDPLEAGLPIVTQEGHTFRSRMGAALLRSLALHELITDHADAYHSLAVQLATDPARRAKIRDRISSAMEAKPLFLDSLAASDAFGALLMTAYDALVEHGRVEFRRNRSPIEAEPNLDVAATLSTAGLMLELGAGDEASKLAKRVLAAEPACHAARHVIGKMLLDQHATERAIAYLMAAVESGQAEARVWRDLAIGLRRIGNHDGFLQAVETALRLDGADVDTWFLLGEAAHECGHRELLQQVHDAVEKLAPHDPRTATLQARLATVSSAAT
jgi:predicted O-linked N-acetylglucosamine transferase (SPINDLY family)